MQVAKVTHLSSPSANVKTTPAQVTSIPPVPTDNEVIKVGVTLKVYAKCLAPDIEYKTVIVTKNMSSRELICLLLSKCRMKHRDPKVIKTLNVRIEDNNHFYILSCFTLQWMSLLRRQGYQSRGPWSLRMKLGQHN